MRVLLALALASAVAVARQRSLEPTANKSATSPYANIWTPSFGWNYGGYYNFGAAAYDGVNSDYYPGDAYYADSYTNQQYSFKTKGSADKLRADIEGCRKKAVEVCKAVQPEQCKSALESHEKELVAAGCPSKDKIKSCKAALHQACGEVKEGERPSEDQVACAEAHRADLMKQDCILPSSKGLSAKAHHRAKHHQYPWGWAGYGATEYYGWGGYYGSYDYFPTYPYWGAYSDGTPYWNGYYYGPSYWNGGYYYGFRSKAAKSDESQPLEKGQSNFMASFKQCANKVAEFCSKSTKTGAECADALSKNYEALTKAGCPSKETSTKCRAVLTSNCGEVKKGEMPSDAQLECVEKNRVAIEGKGCALPSPNQPEFKITEAASPKEAAKHHRAKQWPLQTTYYYDSYYTPGTYGYCGYPSLDYYGYTWGYPYAGYGGSVYAYYPASGYTYPGYYWY